MHISVETAKKIIKETNIPDIKVSEISVCLANELNRINFQHILPWKGSKLPSEDTTQMSLKKIELNLGRVIKELNSGGLLFGALHGQIKKETLKGFQGNYIEYLSHVINLTQTLHALSSSARKNWKDPTRGIRKVDSLKIAITELMVIFEGTFEQKFGIGKKKANSEDDSPGLRFLQGALNAVDVKYSKSHLSKIVTQIRKNNQHTSRLQNL